MSEDQLQTLKNTRRGIKSAVTLFEKFLGNIEDINRNQLKNRIDKFLNTYDEFKSIQTQIENLDESEYDSNEREDFENRFFELQTRSQQLITNRIDASGSVSGSSNALVKLPTISLPSFSGAYEDWFPFHDTFISLIHNDSSLLDIQKFHYLKSCLKGEAANVLHCLEISSNNYQVAWEMLENRYSNKRLIIKNHIEAICDLPVASKENHVVLRQIIDGINKHIRALDSLKRPVNKSDDLLIHILTTKLDSATIKEWETNQSNDNLPTYEEMIVFLNRKCQTLEAISKGVKNDMHKNDMPKFKRTSTHIVINNKKSSCAFCKQYHAIYKCQKLISLPIEQRIQEIKAKRLCINCLKPGHFVSNCLSSDCIKCGKRHNTLLHKTQELIEKPQQEQLHSISDANVDTSISNHAFTIETSTQILLSTAIVRVIDCKGNKHACRVLLDSGSQSNLITTALVDKLNLHKKSVQISITGINQEAIRARNLVNVSIASLQTNFKTNLECLMLDKISDRIPLISLARECINIPKNIKLADPEFHVSKNIDMLLGVELFYKLLCVGQINLGNDQPCLQKTLLGWLVSGRAPTNSSLQATSICNISTLNELNKNIKKFWEVENIYNSQAYSPEEKLCETHFINSTTRNDDGRFVISLPFRNNNLLLGNSRDLALKRLYALEKRFAKNPTLKADYTNFINDYIELGHMRPANNLWWKGPPFLKHEKSCWPRPQSFEKMKELPETRRVVNLVSANGNQFELFTKYSNLSRLQRVVAYCLRFKSNLLARIHKNHTNIVIGSLKSSELSNSMICLLKICQSESFRKDHYELSVYGKVCSSSKLLCLNPFLDDEGIMRVGGRLKNAQVSYSQKHQALLPSRHALTELIIRSEHIKQLHAGVQLTIASLRSMYWPLSARTTVRSIIRKCITCFKTRPTAVKYLMGNLPLSRVIPARPFQNVGVDYFGPLYIREGNRRKSSLVKSYGAVFLCFATKAIHIELVSNLTAECFIAALKRFTARRGKISNIYSDNGTQFVGANKELLKLMNQLHNQVSKGTVSEYFAREEISWHFIPPRSPHFGGLWEAAVKSIKTHLIRVIGKTSLNYEEMYTILVQIEGVLNSRPITPLSNDPTDLSFLTPSHFLTGDIANSLAEPSVEHLKLNTLSRWQYIQRIREHFWKRWRKEYLNELQARTKWNRTGNCILTPGVLVIVKEDNIPPGQWLLGRVVKVFPGEDGIVRTASVKTLRGVFQRPATKLCVLPISNDDGNNL